MISVAAELGIADLLATVRAPATTSRRSPRRTRLAVSVAARTGQCGDLSPRTATVEFGLTPLADLLRASADGSMRGLALFQNDEWYWQVYRDLPYSVRTWPAATQHLWGHGLFGYFPPIPRPPKCSTAAWPTGMPRPTRRWPAPTTSRASALVDVGGGNGSCWPPSWRPIPSMHGVLFRLAARCRRRGRAIGRAGSGAALSGRWR